MEYTAINRAIQKEISKVLKKISVDHGLDYETLVSEHLTQPAPVAGSKKMEAERKKAAKAAEAERKKAAKAAEAERKKAEKEVKKAEAVLNKKKSKIDRDSGVEEKKEAVKNWGKLGNRTKLWMWVAECGYIEELTEDSTQKQAPKGSFEYFVNGEFDKLYPIMLEEYPDDYDPIEHNFNKEVMNELLRMWNRKTDIEKSEYVAE
tara:strand:- start:1651 stop:2265 length:615 start_codon:yes stop_codon:yes gene_type:complete